MNRSRPDIESIVSPARDQPADPRRDASLATACGDNAALRQRVEALLAADSQASEAIGQSAPGGTAVTDAEATEVLAPTHRADPDATNASLSPTALYPVAHGRESLRQEMPSSIASDRARDRDGLAPGAVLRYFGDYEIRRELGRGAMGLVYEARQVSLDRLVALKVIKAGLLAGDDDLRRFRNEAQAVALLDHPGVVPVYEVGRHEGQDYFTMKLVRGGSLIPLPARYKDDPRAAARLVAEAAEAVAHAHARGILHRDLKPGNILVGDDGRPYVTDFGLAKRLEADVEMTESGAIVGTPAYMSPEQAGGRSGAVTIASDVYGLGAVLYALLAGRAPFAGRSVVETLDAVRHAPPEPPSKDNPRVSRDLETVCLKCLQKDPRQRYATAQALADDLVRWLDGRPILARPASPAERAVKWMRRHKVVAALCGVAAGGALAGISGLAWGWTTAIAARDEAIKGEDIARHHDYASRINLAERDWQDANVAQLLRRLDETRPAGKSDLRGFEWYYLDRLARSQGRTLSGHRLVVAALAYSPDGARIASGDWDGQIKLWDARTGRPIRSMAGQHVNAVAFHPDGTRLATAGGHREVTIWDVATGQVIRTLPKRDHEIFELAFSPDGKALAAAGTGGTIELWNADAGALVRALPDHRAGGHGGMAFSPDGKTLASAGAGEPSIRFWDVATGQRVRTLEDDSMQRRGVLALGPDGRFIASGRVDGAIAIWDAMAGRVIRTLRDYHNRDVVTSLAFTRDGKTLAAGGENGQVTLWDVRAGDQVRTLKGHSGPVMRVAFDPDGVHLASSSYDATVRLWDITRDQEAGDLRAKDVILDVAFSPDGSFLVSGGTDRNVTLWDTANGRVVRTLTGHTDNVVSVAISPDGRHAASAAFDATARIWDVATGRAVHVLAGHTADLNAVAYGPDGTMLATGGDDRSVKLWSAATGSEIRTLHGHIGPVKAVTFGPDGKTLVSADVDRFVVFWDVATGRRVREIRTPAGALHSIALSPDGGWLAVSSAHPSITIWDAASGRAVHTLSGHAFGAYKLAFSRDSQRLISAGHDRTVRIWDPLFGQELLVLRGHSDVVQAVAFAPDGARIASAGFDRTIRLWEGAAQPAPGPSR